MRRRPRAPRSTSYEAERMAGSEERYETPGWRTAWLLAGFALLVGIAVVTVVLPELEDEPDRDSELTTDETEEAAHTGPLQE
jgi:hypothetical protein